MILKPCENIYEQEHWSIELICNFTFSTDIVSYHRNKDKISHTSKISKSIDQYDPFIMITKV